ncbi:MAG: hypothetical protein LAO24_20635 [Acidobacteriia bacterium]|nr:hypothetical protein [Terriglobia bacterium]
MRMLRGVRLAALAAVVSLALGSLAWAHDGDDYYDHHDEAREHGYRNGYQDGVQRGRYDRMQGYRYNFKSQLWDDGDGGYEHWMGSRGHYKKAYRDGYVNGYREGYSAYGYRRDRDRDDHYRGHDRDDWR